MMPRLDEPRGLWSGKWDMIHYVAAVLVRQFLASFHEEWLEKGLQASKISCWSQLRTS